MPLTPGIPRRPPDPPTPPQRVLGYLLVPGNPLKILGGAVALGTLLSPLFTHPSLRNLASGLGCALMVWWLGFKLREKRDRIADESRPLPLDQERPPR